MTVLEEIAKHKKEILEIAAQCGCIDVRVFGSVARGEETEKSDIDFLVNIEKGYNLLDMVRFQRLVQKKFDRKVDVVLEKGLHWFIKDDVLDEAKFL